MRKITLSMNITADGMVASADYGLDWHFPFWDTEMGSILSALLNEVDTILLGRNTYNAFSNYWPNVLAESFFAREDIVLAEMMNRHTKVVYSRTLKDMTWNNTVAIHGDIFQQIHNLKMNSGKDIILIGSPKLAIQMMELNLIDQYIFWVHPVFIGSGLRFFRNRMTKDELKLINEYRLGSGVVIEYRQSNIPQNIR